MLPALHTLWQKDITMEVLVPRPPEKHENLTGKRPDLTKVLPFSANYKYKVTVIGFPKC